MAVYNNSAASDDEISLKYEGLGLSKEQFRKQMLSKHTKEIVEHSTLHGFHYGFDKRYRFRRILWIIIVVVSFGILIKSLIGTCQKYLDRPLMTDVRFVNVREKDFPAITICNINDIRLSKVKNTRLHEALKGQLPFSSMSSEEYTNVTAQAEHSLKDMLMECKIHFMSRFGTSCSYKNFTKLHQVDGSKCFTINPGVIRDRGRSKSLEMVLNIEHHDYYEDTEEAGMRLLVHDENETPTRFSGVHVSPGFTTYIEVQKTETLNLKKPYKTACDSRKLDYFTYYSENTCWLERLTKYVTEKCGCKDRFMPGDVRICTLETLFICVWPKWEIFAKKFSPEDIDCPIPCKVVEYGNVLSFTKYPSNKIADKWADKLNVTGSTSARREFVRDNLLRVVVYFEKLQYKQIIHIPSFDFMTLLVHIGAQLSLFLGTSILTYLEFIDYLIMVIYTKYFERFHL